MRKSLSVKWFTLYKDAIVPLAFFHGFLRKDVGIRLNKTLSVQISDAIYRAGQPGNAAKISK